MLPATAPWRGETPKNLGVSAPVFWAQSHINAVACQLRLRGSGWPLSRARPHGALGKGGLELAGYSAGCFLGLTQHLSLSRSHHFSRPPHPQVTPKAHVTLRSVQCFE